MPRASHSLPRLGGPLYLTDGGLETTLVFLEGIELPCFAAFPLVLTDEGRQRLGHYFAPYLRTAAERGLGFILDTPTWRANPDWGKRLGFSPQAIADANRRSAAWAAGLGQAHATATTHIVINGVVGPRGDGYEVSARMSDAEAQQYHALQIEALCDAGVDMITAVTMTYPEEAIGIVRAARAVNAPVVVSFTVETDGRLPSGDALGEAIGRVDRDTADGPLYYMINCAHPSHFDGVVSGGTGWAGRIGGVRANASTKSHAELDESDTLDPGDPADLAGRYLGLCRHLKQLAVVGGCCGTDHRHIVAICDAFAQNPRARQGGAGA
ncbi:homocysteine S-methyltransferase family protein [Cupriavidus sp. 2TAF22]|uniref:homocysteine S-methyltransferase family protein n=1 Tax=unclassified Cupriavidus TaxID=2640874 RepID=UPI003F915A0B